MPFKNKSHNLHGSYRPLAPRKSKGHLVELMILTEDHRSKYILTKIQLSHGQI